MTVRAVLLNHKDELIRLLRTSRSLLEEDMEILDGNLGSEEFPLIDLVAKGRHGRPILIHADISPDEKVFLNATAQMEWFLSNRPLLKRIFPELCLEDKVPPRAALIYPEFSLLMKRFVRAAPPSLAPLLLQYRCFEAEGRPFLYLERLDPPKEFRHVVSENEEHLPPFRSGISNREVVITPEERDTFYA